MGPQTVGELRAAREELEKQYHRARTREARAHHEELIAESRQLEENFVESIRRGTYCLRVFCATTPRLVWNNTRRFFNWLYL